MSLFAQSLGARQLKQPKQACRERNVAAEKKGEWRTQEDSNL
jgi:hypothetical protein